MNVPDDATNEVHYTVKVKVLVLNGVL